jgi:hypothetical protein
MADERAVATFDAWIEAFVEHVRAKGAVPGTQEAARGAVSTT